MGGAKGNGGFEVIAHAHGQDGKAVAGRDPGQQAEMGTRRFAHRRNAHQPLHRQGKVTADPVEEGVCVGGEHAGLLGLLTRIHLDQEPWQSPGLLGCSDKGQGQPVPVQALDDVEEGRGGLGLVGLERPDEPQLEAFPAAGPAGLGLLDAILTEHPVPGGDHGGDGLPGLLLGDSRQGNAAGRAGSRLLGGGDSG